MGAKKNKDQEVRPNVFCYHDYRVFLKDWLDYKKSSQSSFSLRSLAKSSKVAVGYINMVLSGSRNLTEKGLNKIKKHLSLSPSEISFLNQLRIIGDSEVKEEQLAALQKIQRFQEYRKYNPKDIEAYKYLTKWYHVAIREMTALPGFQLNAQWIQSQMKAKLTIKEIESAIQFLIENEIIKIDESQKVIKPNQKLDCTEGIYKISLSEFHTQMLKLAEDSIYNTPRRERLVLGHTVAVPKNKLNELNQILYEALEKVQNLGGATESSKTVYHVNLNAFPLTQISTNKEDRNEEV